MNGRNYDFAHNKSDTLSWNFEKSKSIIYSDLSNKFLGIAFYPEFYFSNNSEKLIYL